MKLSSIHDSKIPERKLGKTDKSVTILGLGGQGSLETQGTEKNCIEIIQRAFELGITYADTSPIYGDGSSEKYYGEAMGSWRKKIFLASKTDIRDRDGSLKEIEGSLKRLKTDYLDLWQIHHLDTIEEVNQITKKGGALEALIQMHEEGVIRHLGITGHSHPPVLLEMMKRHNFDTVLCPVNIGDRSMNPPFIDTVVREAHQRHMGVIGMKVLAQGYVFHPKGATTVWEPLVYAMSQPVSTIILGIDTIAQLEECVAIARGFRPMSRQAMAELENLTKPHRRRACFFRREYGGYDSKDDLDPPYIINNYDINK